MPKRFLALSLLAGLVACGSESPTDPTDTTGLVIEDIFVGNGAPAEAGDILTVHYVLRLMDGTRLESSYDRNEPFTFQLGVGEVIRGWDLGLLGMKAGGKRRLTVPPSLAYGDQQVGPIPPNSTLRFEVDLLSIVPM